MVARTVIVALVFAVFSQIAVAQGEKPQGASMTASEIIQKADNVFNSREYDKSRDIYMSAIDAAVGDDKNSDLTEVYSMVARTYLITGKKEEGRPWIDKAKDLANPEQPMGWSRYLGVRGRFEWQDDEKDKATKTFKEMYDYCSTNKLHSRAIDAAHMVAITGSLETQVEWGLKGINEAEEGNVTGWLGPLWNNLGATYEEMNEYEKSLDAYQKAREYHWLHGDEMNKLIADWAVGHAFRLAGHHEEAAKWIRPVLAWCERIDANEFIGWSCKELGEIELAKGNNSAALEYFVRAEEKLKAEAMPEWDPDGYKALVDQISELRDKH